MDACKGKTEHLDSRQGCFHHLRYVIISLGGLAMGVMMFLRLSITVTMVGMVNHTQLFIHSHPNMSQEELENVIDMDHGDEGEFDWNNETQDMIFSCYMITYMSFQFLTTKLISSCGLRWGVSVSLALCAIFNGLTPIVAYWGPFWVLLLRLAHGAAASGTVPSMVNLIERWMPKDKSSEGIVLYQFIGNILAVAVPLIGGILASHHWKWAFYIPGVVALIFCIIWCIFVSDGPEKSTIISARELELFRGNSTQDMSGKESELDARDAASKDSRPDIPFHYIFKTKEFYSLAFIWCTYGATSGSFILLLPAYIHSVFQVPVDQVGALTSIAQIGSLFSMLWPNRVSGFLMNKCGMSLTASRRIVVAIAVIMANLALIWIAYYRTYLIALLSIQRFFHMTHDTVFMATVMSQFGPHGLSGITYSFMNSFCCLFQVTFSILAGKFLDYAGDTPECWSWIFVAFVVMNTLYLFVYALFCHSDPVKLKSKASGVENQNK